MYEKDEDYELEDWETPRRWLPERGHPDRIGVAVGVVFFTLLIASIIVGSCA